MEQVQQRPGPRFAPMNYRPCVGVLLVNRAGEVFVGQRIDSEIEAWQLPQGGVDQGEDPRAAALRELYEEVGTDRVRIVAETVDWLSYDLPEELRGKVWKGKYRGQRQKWFVMAFEGDDADIDIATAHPEFKAWRWATLDLLPDLAVPFKRGIYAELVRRFAPLVEKLRAGEI